MSFHYFFLKIAHTENRLLHRTQQITNTIVKLPRPVRIKVAGQKICAETLDRIVSLWLRKFTSMERFELKLWTEIIQPGMVVADIGANLGFYTLLAASRIGSSGWIHAFEPDPENCALLARSIKANGYKNVTTYQVAIADRIGEAFLYLRKEHRGDHRIYQHGQFKMSYIQVPLTTLDSVFSDSKRLDMVKIDIQGAEWMAILGMKSLIAENPQIKIFTEFWPDAIIKSGGNPKEFLRLIHNFGLQIQNINDKSERLEKLSDSEILEICRSSGDTNLLLYRQNN